MRLNRERITAFLDDVWSSFWFVPALIFAAELALAAALVAVDASRAESGRGALPGLFPGDAAAARGLLAAVAGSLVTAVAVAFSATVVAVQQAASQYSPRVLRRFSRDRPNQLVLGVFTGTFAYALFVLRAVGETVPSLAVTVCTLLTLLSAAMLVFFIHHITNALRVSTTVRLVRDELDAEAAALCPGPAAPEEPEPPPPADLLRRSPPAGRRSLIRSREEGYLRGADDAELGEALRRCGARAALLRAAPGDYIVLGQVVAAVWSAEPVGPEQARAIAGSLVLDAERSVRHDPLFGVRQISDIAIKALSPGINDPTTAEECMDALTGFLARLLPRRFPGSERELHGIRVLEPSLRFSDLAQACFGQVRRAASGHAHVLERLLEGIGRLAAIPAPPARREALAAQVRALLGELDEASLTSAERERVRARAVRLRARLRRAPEAGAGGPTAPRT